MNRRLRCALGRPDRAPACSAFGGRAHERTQFGRSVGLARGSLLQLDVRSPSIVTLLRSVAVGAGATAVDLLALTLCVELLHLDPRIANVPALLLGVACQFIGNKYLAFEDRSSAWAKQGVYFAGVEALALLLNATLFHFVIATGVVPYLLARVGVQAVVYLGFSLPLWSRIFSKRSAS